jgi:hypothetical protein
MVQSIQQTTAGAVCEILASLFACWGLPKEVISDNESFLLSSLQLSLNSHIIMEFIHTATLFTSQLQMVQLNVWFATCRVPFLST